MTDRWLVTGAGGMLGHDLKTELAGQDAVFATRADLDVTDLGAVRAAVAGRTVIVNAAAFTEVDLAETEFDAAFAVNATGAENLAIAAEETGATLVQISTDYVFDGTAHTPYEESAPVSPTSVYGRTKAEGERLALAAHPTGTLVLRTAWLYGAGGPNFISTILGVADTQQAVPVLTDQRGQPTWTLDLAGRILQTVAAKAPAGIYSATNTGDCSRYEFAREIFRLAGLDPERVVPAEGEQFARPAPRPAYSVLGQDAWSRAGLSPLRDWRAALADAHDHGVF